MKSGRLGTSRKAPNQSGNSTSVKGTAMDPDDTGMDLLEGLSLMEEDPSQVVAILAWMGIGENGDEPEE